MNVPRPISSESVLESSLSGPHSGAHGAHGDRWHSGRRPGGSPAPRSAGEALIEGLRLWVVHRRSMLPVALLGWAPGEALRLLALLLPLPARDRVALSLGALALSLAGAAFVTAAVIGTLTGPVEPRGAAGQAHTIDVFQVGLSRMAEVLRTQVLLLALLLATLLPPLLSVGRLLEGSGPGGLWCLLALLICLPVFSLLGLRFSLALTAAAVDEAGVGALRRSAVLARGRLLDLVAFGLLWAGFVAPLLLCSASCWLLLLPKGLLLLSHGVGIGLGLLFTLQGQGAAVGLALLYADACEATGLKTRLSHLARQRHYR